jgi:hypothetical protein
MARGGAGAKVAPSLAGMGEPPVRAGPRQTERERAPGGAPRGAAPPAEFRRPPTRLKVPRPLVVEAEEGPDGPVPRGVTWRGTRRAVATVEDDWRVDDEWWRDEVSRHYFTVTLADGCRLTLFFDRLAGTWWEQRC